MSVRRDCLCQTNDHVQAVSIRMLYDRRVAHSVLSARTADIQILMGGPLSVQNAQWATKVLVLGYQECPSPPSNSRKVQSSVHLAQVVFTKIRLQCINGLPFLPQGPMQYCRYHWKKLVGNTTVLCVLPDSTLMCRKVECHACPEGFQAPTPSAAPANRVKRECIETLFVLLEMRVQRVAPNVLQGSMQTQPRQ